MPFIRQVCADHRTILRKLIFPGFRLRRHVIDLGIVRPLAPLSTGCLDVEEYLSGSRLFQRLKSGPLAQYVELYGTRLVRDGLGRQSTWLYFSLLNDLNGLAYEQRSAK